jgi:hypothetical protein
MVKFLKVGDLIWNVVWVSGILILAEGQVTVMLIGLGIVAFFDLVALGVRTGYVGYEGGGVCFYWPRVARPS